MLFIHKTRSKLELAIHKFNQYCNYYQNFQIKLYCDKLSAIPETQGFFAYFLLIFWNAMRYVTYMIFSSYETWTKLLDGHVYQVRERQWTNNEQASLFSDQPSHYLYQHCRYFLIEAKNQFYCEISDFGTNKYATRSQDNHY